MLAALVLLFLLIEPRTLGILFYIPALLMAGITIVLVEWLYARLWIQIPIVASQMINTEISAGTWDIIRSTPLPRYQLVTSKFAALFWMSELSMGVVLSLRSSFVILMVTLYFSLQGYAFDIGAILQMFFIALLLVLIPLVEINILATLGLFISATVPTTWWANFLSLATVFIYRLVAAVLFLNLVLAAQSNQLIMILPLLLFPHWTLLIYWVAFPAPAWTTLETGAFIEGVILIYFVFPVFLSMSTLWLTIRGVQRA
jgi:ABC-type transport system involved in multi-copper enzyme maturation permease subunit